jgi:hypothetical protein
LPGWLEADRCRVGGAARQSKTARRTGVRLVRGPDGEAYEVNPADHVEKAGLYGRLASIRRALTAVRRPAGGALPGLPGWRNSANVDLIAIDMTGLATILLLLVPFIPACATCPGRSRCTGEAPGRGEAEASAEHPALPAWLALSEEAGDDGV